MFGDGQQTRSFCLRGRPDPRHRPPRRERRARLPVNIGNPDERTLLDLAEIVKRITGSSSEIVFEALRVDDPMQRKPDITRAQQLLGWEPEISLEEGLSRLLREQGREPIGV